MHLPCAERVGTMANYLAMQERKRKQAANDVAASGSGTKTDRVPETDMPFFENEEVEPAIQALKRLRGKTRMDKVHTRPFEKRVVISVNDKFQTVSDDDKRISELSNFLGTLKKCVTLTYASWEHVLKSFKDTFWSYTKEGAEKNSKNRSEYKDTHTVGPKLFSQIQHKMCGRKYKTSPEVMNFIIETIKKKLDSSEGVDGVEELVSCGQALVVSLETFD
ncbi:hypothetical protein POM88_008959 [Heracleum sosnowskyi]|uniref:Uncharacterized protein n=1 Tax=Heracleum sosnowskyi TaxID=360622 RepID=A0AAD8J8G1_9APIA|nr:hypothetical protein POM88_008959 [Heracleum sosnowskyi]